MEAKARRIAASRDLQNKVGTGTVNEAVVSRAQKVMDTNTVDFAPLAQPDLTALQNAIDNAKTEFKTPEAVDHKAILQSFKTPVMNIKSNAGTFKYEFVSQLTAMVLLLLENKQKVDTRLIKVVDVLHKTTLLALAYDMKGNGGDNGQVLLESFKKLCEKCGE